MFYEWKCGNCDAVTVVQRPVAQYDKPPEDNCEKCDCWGRTVWRKVIASAPSVPFQTLRDRGVFMDEHGNYPPRKMD